MPAPIAKRLVPETGNDTWQRKEWEERLAWKVIREMQEKAYHAARLEALHRPPPKLTLREVWDLDYFERVRNRNRRRGM